MEANMWSFNRCPVCGDAMPGKGSTRKPYAVGDALVCDLFCALIVYGDVPPESQEVIPQEGPP